MLEELPRQLIWTRNLLWEGRRQGRREHRADEGRVQVPATQSWYKATLLQVHPLLPVFAVDQLPDQLSLVAEVSPLSSCFPETERLI